MNGTTLLGAARRAVTDVATGDTGPDTDHNHGGTTGSVAPARLQEAWCFGEIEIDVGRRTIRRAGAEVDVQPRVFDLIVHLVRHRARLVSRTELLDEVWGTRFVADSTINGRVRAARRALGDTGDDQLMIRTVHGRGYRFVGGDVLENGHDPTADLPLDRGAARSGADIAAVDERSSGQVRASRVGSDALDDGGSSREPPHLSDADRHHVGTDDRRLDGAARLAAPDDWPLVGRADALDRIRLMYQGDDVGGVVLTGLEGVGTTRLALAAAERLDRDGARVAFVRGLSGAHDVPLSGLAHLVGDDVLESIHTAEDLARASVMHKATTAVRDLARGERRLVLVVDEPHYLDAMSAAVVASLIERRSVFVVIAARRTATGTGGLFEWLVQSGGLRSITVEPLSPIQIDVLLYRILRGPVDAQSLERIVDASAGRPGIVRQVVDRARASGTLRLESGVWRLIGSIPALVGTEWPVSDLSDAAVRAAEVVAVAGEIPVDVLTGLSDPGSIDELDDRRLLTVSFAAGEPVVSLRDDELVGAVRDSIGALRLRRLRRLLADRLMAASPDDPAALATVIDCVGEETDVVVDRAHACEVARRAMSDGQVARATRLIDRMDGWSEPDAMVLRANAALERSQWDLADSLVSATGRGELPTGWGSTAAMVAADLDFFRHARHDEAISTLVSCGDRDEFDTHRAAARRAWLLAEQGDAAALHSVLDGAGAATVLDLDLAAAVHAILVGRFSEAIERVDLLDRAVSLSSRQRDACASIRCEALRSIGRTDEARERARSMLGRPSGHSFGVLPLVSAMLDIETGHTRAARATLGALADSGYVGRHPHLAPIVFGTAGVVEHLLANARAADALLASAERDIGLAPNRIAWMFLTTMATALRGVAPDRCERAARAVATQARSLGADVPEAEAIESLLDSDREHVDRPMLEARLVSLTAGFDGQRRRRR